MSPLVCGSKAISQLGRGLKIVDTYSACLDREKGTIKSRPSFIDKGVDTVKEAAMAPMRNPDNTSLLYKAIKSTVGLSVSS